METPKIIGSDPTVVIDAVPYPVRYGSRSLAMFGDMSGRHINDMSKEMTFTEMYQMYYSGINAGCARNKIPCLSFEEFMNAIDDDHTVLAQLVEIKQEQDAPKK